jgi:hypothetical protein
MAASVCYHCKQTLKPGEPHDCWTTTEAALTRDLPEELQEAWSRLRETAASFGEQRIYASHKSIMFSRTHCYFFVRPKRNFLEVCIFLGRRIRAPQIRRVDQASKSKLYHIVHVTHRDEVEPPFTDWLREAYDYGNAPTKPAAKADSKSRSSTTRPQNPVSRPRTSR